MIPSLLQIPSAVSDSKLHSVLPNNGKGDFTFDRSTGATRINKDGLIEEVESIECMLNIRHTKWTCLIIVYIVCTI